MRTESFFQKMSDGFEVFVNRWMPDNDEDIKGVVQLSHGMLEHSLRYDRLGCILAENGYVFSAHDHRGHGKTAQNAEQKGVGLFYKLADKNGFDRVLNDLDEVINKLKDDFKGKKVCLLSHSFGSLVAQNYIEDFGEKINACVLIGSSGPNKKAFIGKIIYGFVKFFKGANYKSKFCNDLLLGFYSKQDPNWVCKNPTTIMMYENDSWCGGIPTVSFLQDITIGAERIHKIKNIKRIPKKLPIYIASGTDDPVGDFGKSLIQLENIYKKNNIENVTLKLYPGLKHELLNEEEGDKIIESIISWFEQYIC